jgi:hypothetical protein
VSLPKGLWRRSTRNNMTGTALVPDTLTDIGGGACFNDARVQVRRWQLHSRSAKASRSPCTSAFECEREASAERQ